MTENTNRSIFALDGITGYLIATALLLGLLAGLTVWGIQVQQANATNYYTIENSLDLQMNSADNAAHRKYVK